MVQDDYWLRNEVRSRRDVPAVLRDRHLEVVASNPLAHALSPGFREGVNMARYTFVDSSDHEGDGCWDEAAREVAAMLRDSLDHHDADPHLRRVVGELSARSDHFAAAFASQGHPSRSGTATFLSTPVGALTLSYTEEWADSDHEYALLLFDASTRDLDAERLHALAMFLEADPFDE